MKKSNQYILSTIVLILTFSCTSNSGRVTSIEGIKVAGEELMLSEIAVSIEEIPLETRDDLLVQYVGAITKSDRHIYIKDRDRIIKFRMDGTYEGVVARQGEGPGEYLGARGISYDINGESLLVAAHFNQAILKYGEEGELLGSKHFPYPFYVNATDNGIWVLSHGGYIQSKNNGNLLTIMGYQLDKNLKVTDSVLVKKIQLPGNHIMGSYTYQQYISSIEDRLFVYFAPIMNEDFYRDTLYHLKNNKLEPYRKFDLSIFDEKKIINILEITSNGNFYFITYLASNNQISMLVYDMSKNVGYDLKNGITAEDGKSYVLNSFGDGDYFYIKRETDESGLELNPTIVLIKLKK
ncbi:6-bladed beta-propeller [Cyclobacterium plantarum]|uniref:6-bladed beta-propeller n=1 Tax=Cyclobacterium plantarum TaxID=2716263 RepID=A0ABX0HBJ8_9BACT|nr:6-bladed beta-propeller [Cyclobacterium plantarum]NHE57571.1 6-bladed beta-propeller [Cyclobacterium plantarum]